MPEAAREALGKDEVARQSNIFELFKAEREYVSDLEAVFEVRHPASSGICLCNFGAGFRRTSAQRECHQGGCGRVHT